MVSNLSIGLMIFSVILSILFPMTLLIYYKKKDGISFKPLLIGALMWFIFTQILEKLLNVFVMSTVLFNYSILFTIYACLAAGIFEEIGRFTAFKIFLKNRTEWKDGMAYGIGHGGFEAIFLVGIGYIQNIIFAKLLNSGTLLSSLGSNVTAAQFQALKGALTAPAYTFALGGIERIFSIIVQIALTFVVLYGIRNRKNIFLLYAILLHALLDFVPGLYATHVIKNLIGVEFVIFIFACIAIIGIAKSKQMFLINPIVYSNKVDVKN
ncbi:YhfC family intramembrane metalloprotease [Clostridium sp.]